MALLVLGASGLALPKAWSIGLLLAGSALFLCLFLLLIWNGSWWRPAAYAAAVLLLAGIGGSVLASAQDFLVEAGRVSLGLRPTKPWWLLALLLAPLIVVWSYRSLASLGPVRRWIAIGLRCLLIVLLTLALAEVRSTRHNENVTVLFLVDRSLSIPKEYDETAATGGTPARIGTPSKRLCPARSRSRSCGPALCRAAPRRRSRRS